MEKSLADSLLKDFLFITGGDPASIAPEIIRKSLSDLGIKYQNLRIFYFFNSSNEEIEKLFLELKDWEIYLFKDWSEKEFKILENLSKPDTNALFIYQIGNYNKTYPTKQSGKLSIEALKKAIQFIKLYGCKGLVTAPVSKEWIAKIEPNFRGHTGYLAKRFQCNVIMIMYSSFFSVIPLTEHIPLKKVSSELKKILNNPSFITLFKELNHKKIFKKEWAICGLNPHAGDNGYIGNEEKEYIIPFVQKLKRAKVPIDGPFSADSLFLPEKLQKYDLILACYHDQGLIPFKTLVGREGINLTFGLPFLRTSPDHGTAYDIAFKDIADYKSMYNAIEIHYNDIWS
ncbi:MAG: 4-hydroxythreonine-4-phosphate dehydrogenase [Leptospiraceae bacterium]|nr:MAG: 4-hydroxythreonine-4-phosphate dehydrogenase [Leptospiraceae bacterium]